MTWQAAFWCTAALCRIVSQNGVGVCVRVCVNMRLCLSRAYMCVYIMSKEQVLKRMKLTGARFVRSVPLAVDGQRNAVQSVIWLFWSEHMQQV